MGVFERASQRVENLIPATVSPDNARRLAFAIWFSLTATIFLSAFALVNLSSNPTAAIALGAFVLPMAAVPAVVRFSPRPKLGAHLFVLLTLVALTAVTVAKGGLNSSPAGWLPGAAFVFVLVLGNRGALPWVGVLGALQFGLAWQGAADWDERLGPVYVYAASRAGASLFCFWLATVFESARKRAFGTLEQRRQETRLLLDNAEEGFLSVDKDGQVGQEWSAMVESWLGAPPESRSLVDWVAQVDPLAAEWVELGLESLAEDFMPEELALEQLERRLQAGERTLQLQGRPMGQPGRYLILLTDLTETLARLAAEESQRETTTLLDHLARDRSGVRQLVAEVDGLLAALAGEPDVAVQLRHLHTIKGNAALFGLTSVSGLIHRIEDACAERFTGPIPEELDSLQASWAAVHERVAPWMGEARRIEIDTRDLERIEDAIERRAEHPALGRMVATLRHEPAERALERLGRAAEALAERLEKQVEIHCTGGDIYLPPERWSPLFAALPHVIRNALDHGIETPSQREELGKPACGRLCLDAASVEGRIVISVRDDGAGINWAGIAEVAKAKGLPHKTEDELLAAMFSDGLSTRHTSTEVSGRGVGMAVVLQVVQALGGTVEVDSDPGAGTCFSFTAPLAAPQGGQDPSPALGAAGQLS